MNDFTVLITFLPRCEKSVDDGWDLLVTRREGVSKHELLDYFDSN